MSKKHDKTFVTLVSVVIGSLIGLAVGIFALSKYVGAKAESLRETDTGYRAEVQARLTPVGRVAVVGQDNSALVIPASGPAVTAAPVKMLAVMTGEATYKMVCSGCHATGAAGAPKFGSAADWGLRIKKGLPVLHDHALHGLVDEAGNMPAKGGRPDLPDESVDNAVDYMVKAAK
jgi:cytochrome c5